MGKIRFDIVEDNFSKRSASAYELSILLGMDSFAYMMCDDRQQVQCLREYVLKTDASKDPVSALEQVFREDAFLKTTHRNIRIAFLGMPVTFIPDRLFNTTEKRSYLEHLTGLSREATVRADDLPAYHIKTVYGIDRRMEDLLRRYFPGGRIYHVHSVLLNGLREISWPAEGSRMIANVHSGCFQLIVLRDRELVLANLYHYESAKDFLYYVMLAYDQLNLNAEQVPLYLAGRLVKDSEIYRLLYRYVGQIDFLEPSAFLNLGPKLSEQPRHFYFDLLSLVFCA